MPPNSYVSTPGHDSYDVIIIGGAMMGAAAAWFTAQDPGFDGRILVIDRDPSYEKCSTGHTNSCIRQQFSSALNVRISQFGADFIQNLRQHMGGDPRVPQLKIQNYGYMIHSRSDTNRSDAASRYAARRSQLPLVQVSPAA